MTSTDRTTESSTPGFWETLAVTVLAGIASAAEADQRDVETGLRVDADTVPQLIRRARMERGMSLKDLSRLTGIRDWDLEKMESDTWGVHKMWAPSFDQLVKIKQVLDIHPDSVRAFL